LPSPGDALVTTSDFRPSGRREEHVGAQPAERLDQGRGRAVVDEDAGRRAARGACAGWPERRQPQVRLDGLGRLEPVVEVLDEERQADGQERAAEQRQQQHLRSPGPIGTSGGVACRPPDGAGLELAGDRP
jgi:hypothetical protein